MLPRQSSAASAGVGLAIVRLQTLLQVLQESTLSSPCRHVVEGLNSMIVLEGQAKLEQVKATWTAERQALLDQWDYGLLQLQIRNEQAHLEDMHLLHLSHDSPYRTPGNIQVQYLRDANETATVVCSLLMSHLLCCRCCACCVARCISVARLHAELHC